MENTNTSSTGGIIATVIIIGVVILGGLYFWGKRIELQKEQLQMMQKTSQQKDYNDTRSLNATTSVQVHVGQ